MMLFRRLFFTASFSGLLLASGQPTHALSVGQIDDFQDGTTQGWTVSVGPIGGVHPAPPANVATGGPAGAGDNFLMLTSVGGASAGSRLTALNLMTQWAGNYIAAGIHSITMDVRNFGISDLSLRLVFEDPTVGPPSNIAFSADPVLVPGGSDWMSISFPIDPAFLLAGLGDVTTALMNTTLLRLYHSPEDNFPNPVAPISAVVTELGVDNIRAVGTATSVPDQNSTALLFGLALALLVVARKNTHRPLPAIARRSR